MNDDLKLLVLEWGLVTATLLACYVIDAKLKGG